MQKMIILRLEGVLQAWDDKSKWGKRTCVSFPTKSGIVGIIACAMGLERGDEEIVRLNDAIKIGIRADRKGSILNDFQTIQGMPDIMTADGKPRNPNTLTTSRYYLNDASFMVVVETSEYWRKKIVEGLCNPVWMLYLGRKCCFPSRPIFEGEFSYSNIIDAIYRHPVSNRHDDEREYELEEAFPECVYSVTRRDSIVGNRKFIGRKVWRGVIKEER